MLPRISTLIIFVFMSTIAGRANDVCPAGYSYIYHKEGRNYCFAVGKDQCSRDQYPCGLDGKQCCPLQQDNPCAPGFDSCKPPGSSQQYGNAKAMCCKSLAKRIPKPKKKPATQKPEPILSGIRLRCRSSIGTGSSDFYGRSAASCQEAYSRAAAEADKFGCSRLGGKYAEFHREKIKTGTCR